MSQKQPQLQKPCTYNYSALKNQKGQLIVEYVLLLSVAVALAVIMRQALVKNGGAPQDSGAVLKAWGSVTTAIGQDDPNSRK